ncbi:MAG: metallophosphoesterase, partial [Thermodesulfovibrionales bacterium]
YGQLGDGTAFPIRQSLINLSPIYTDMDLDRLPDDWESQYFGNLNQGPSDDYDGDGLTNLEEYNYGTDPTKWDTDGDGYFDKEEIDAGTNPNDPSDYPVPPINQPPNCIIELQKNGNRISGVSRGEFFDIYVGYSTDDTGIKEVRFLSDESPNGIVDEGFTWTEDWYSWIESLGPWDYSRKTMAWSFATSGEKEVWVELRDEMGQTSRCSANIFVEYPEFTFAHITDVHVGYGAQEICDPPFYALSTPPVCLDTYPRFQDTLENIASLDPKPTFIIISGDNVESNREVWFENFKAILNTFTLRHQIPVYIVPGNHDRYILPGLGNDFLKQYHKSMGCFELMQNVSILEPFQEYSSYDHSEPQGVNRYNYKFEYGDYLFIGLDSGEDLFQPEELVQGTDPESTGLSIKHIDALKMQDKAKPKIIFMHHPFYTGRKETFIDGIEYEDACITQERESFKNYCIENNVQLVLSGHTHEDHIFKADGDKINYGTEWFTYPLFVQTPSAVKDNPGFPHGYRIVKIGKYGIADPGRYFPTITLPKIAVSVIGSGILNVYDSQGRRTGFGSTIVDIPDSYYTGYYDSITPQTIILYNTSEEYKFEIAGSDEETYGLSIISVEESETATFIATDIPTSSGAVHQYTIDWDVLSQGGEGVTVQIDSNGDGMFEQIITSDNELTEEEFWPYTFEDPRRGTKFFINPNNGTFRFTAPDGFDSRVIKAKSMKVRNTGQGSLIEIKHKYGKTRIFSISIDTGKDFCVALVNIGKKKNYLLTDPPGIE